MIRRLFKRIARESAGFSLIELLVAMLVIALGVMAVVGSMDAASKSIVGAQREEQAIAIGQREIEKLRTLRYDQVDLTTTPTTATGTACTPADDPEPKHPADPNCYVATGPPARFLIKSNYRDNTSAPPAGVPTSGERLVNEIAGGGVVAGPESIAVGSTNVKVWRYVTYRNDNRCPDVNCPGDADSKRITVAVVPDATVKGLGLSKPIYVSTVVTPP